MEAVVYYLLHLVARKNFFVHISYVLGTVAFVSFSYQSGRNLVNMLKSMLYILYIANHLAEIPTKTAISVSPSAIAVTQTLNVSSMYEKRIEAIKDRCYSSRPPTIISEHRKLIDHLGFVLRSRSLFYCSVPKVATRTLLNYITYLHIRDEVIPALTNHSAMLFNARSNLFKADFINQMLSSSVQVEIETVCCLTKLHCSLIE